MLRSTPPGEDGVDNPRAAALDRDIDELEVVAQAHATDGAEPADDDDDDYALTDDEFLAMAREGEATADEYGSQANTEAWERNYKAFHQQHFAGSKYTTADYRNRSRIFIPKTRAAVRKHQAAVAASLFGSLDAVNCMAGDESDPAQRAGAAVVQELVNYRTDRASYKASLPWFHVAMGACQTSVLTGICLSKQYWKLELRRDGVQTAEDEDGEYEQEVYVPDIDRPDIDLIAPENFTIDAAADWRNPAQSAAFINIKYPMRYDEIRARQKDPRNPWRDDVTEAQLRSSGNGDGKARVDGVRRAREQGRDRYDARGERKTFGIIWVWETFIRYDGEDYCFFSAAGKIMLTDPRPVREVYPEQFGERPLTFGYGSFEAFTIFPMSAAESWQPLQQETNDIRNLALDAMKQNVMPVAKVKRGKNIDLEQLKRRGQGTSILVTDEKDVTWEKVQDLSASLSPLMQKLDLEFDDLAGQQNYGTVDSNNKLGQTLGGLKLAAGAANAVQEFDIRVWIETWCEPALTQIVRLEQYYESDPVVLGLCGTRAKLFQKYGVDEITDELLENNITVRVNIGLGAGDPQQRLAKFQSATAVVMPLLAQSPDFVKGKKTIDYEAIMSEVYGAAGYRDGGKRFIKDGEPQGPNPQADAATDKIKSEADKNRALGKKAIVEAIVAAAGIGIEEKKLAIAATDQIFDHQMRDMDMLGQSVDMGHRHGSALAQAKEAARQALAGGQPGQPGDPMAGAGGPSAGIGGGEAPTMPSAPLAGPPIPGADSAIVEQPDSAGVGNEPLGPDRISAGGVPAGDAGQQRLRDLTELSHNMDKQTEDRPKRPRKVRITGRGSDGRVSELEIED